MKRSGQVLLELLAAGIFLALVLPHVPDLADAFGGGPQTRLLFAKYGLANRLTLENNRMAAELQRRQAVVNRERQAAVQYRQASDRAAAQREAEDTARHAAAEANYARLHAISLREHDTLVAQCKPYRGKSQWEAPPACQPVMADVNRGCTMLGCSSE